MTEQNAQPETCGVSILEEYPEHGEDLRCESIPLHYVNDQVHRNGTVLWNAAGILHAPVHIDPGAPFDAVAQAIVDGPPPPIWDQILQDEPMHAEDPRWAYAELSKEAAYRGWPCVMCGVRRGEHADQEMDKIVAENPDALAIHDHPFVEGMTDVQVVHPEVVKDAD